MKWKLVSQEQLDLLIEERVQEALESERNMHENELLLKQANIQALQSQINPHFLYNTLECIRGMALLKDEEDIADIALSLSSFFRYSISGKSNIVTLGEELENCRTYASIQNYRFRGRFRLCIEKEDGICQAILPKLTLQPLVENAILHGLRDTLSDGLVQIRAERVGKDIRVVVSDNGCGMSPETLVRLREKIQGGSGASQESGHTGIGLYNVDRRIRLYFGKEYGLNVFSCEGVGTDMELRFPCRNAAE